MKVAISIFRNILARDGTVVRGLRIAEIIRERHEVTMVSKSRREGKTENDSIWAIQVPLRAIQSVWWNLKLSYVVLRNKFSIVYCSNDYCGFAGLYMWSKVRRYRIIYESHSILSQNFTELRYPKVLVKICQVLERLIIKHAHYVIALAPNIFRYCQAYNNKVELVPLFIDDAFYKSPCKRNESKDSKIVGLVGPFSDPRKRENLHFLYSNIDKFDKRLRFVVIGYCEEKIQNKRIGYTGYLDSLQDYVDRLSHLDAVLVPERIATTGPLNKIIEPMSCSIPVFTTPKGIAGLYWVEPGRDILVFEEDELVDKINKLIFNNELMGEIGNNARQVVERYYSRKANKEKLMIILESVAGRQHAYSLPKHTA